MSRVYILLLNWNNWPDTLECLESLLRLDYPDYRIVVCDNGSTDDSLERLQDWAVGKFDILPARLFPGGQPQPMAKPLPFDVYDQVSVEQGGDSCAPLVVIRNGGNLGFAGGNNVGLRYIMAKGDADFVWLLNNDTIVAPDALNVLAKSMQRRPTAGLCGSTVLNYWQSRRVDALGGAVYLRWFGLAWHVGRWRSFPRKIEPGKIERCMDYVVGASMFVSDRFLREVGLLEEAYFLYYEELDWAMRGKARFTLAYAPESIVYHKVGRSIGTSSHPSRKSLVSDYYTLRNRLKFTRKHFPYALPTVYVGLLLAFVVRLLFGQWRKAMMVLRLIIDPSASFDKCTT